MRGEAKGGKTVTFGEFGLQALDSHWISNRQVKLLVSHDAFMSVVGKFGLKSSTTLIH